MAIKSILTAAVWLALTVTPATAQEVTWTGDDMTIGKGYDTFRGRARGRCVTPDKIGPQPTTGENVRFELRSVENEASLYRKLGVSLSAKYGAVSGSGGYEKETSVNSYSAFFFISALVDVRSESVTRTGMITPEIIASDLDLLRAAPDQYPTTLARFKEKCGDTYISSQVLGGQYIALVEIKTKKTSELETIRAAISGSAGVFSASAEAKSRLEQLTSNREVYVNVVRGGGDGASIPTTPAGLVDAVTKYPEALRSLPSHKLTPSRVIVEEYITLDVPANVRRSDFDYLKKQIFVEDADSFVSKHRDGMANAAYALANADQFPPFDRAVLESYVQQSTVATRDVSNKIRSCLQGITQCANFNAPALAIVSPPPRIDGPSRTELEASINRSRAALDAIVFRQGDDVRRYCREAVPNAADLEGVVGCYRGYEQTKKRCTEAGCRP